MPEAKIYGARVLVVVKAYPNPSRGYQETVCTAGLLNGERWIRIYPVPYRFLQDDSKYPKFGWIELDLERRDKDFRPESYRLLRGEQEPIKLHGRIEPSEDGWALRRKHVLRSFYTSMADLIADAYGPRHVSIGVLKPSQITDVVAEPNEDCAPVEEVVKCPDLFADEDDSPSQVRPVRRLPYKFYYVFSSADGKVRRLMIEDWEIGALYWHCFDKSLDENDAVEKVRAKYLGFAASRDVYLILGTVFRNHVKSAPNPFVIIGVFYPPRVLQYQLFDTSDE